LRSVLLMAHDRLVPPCAYFVALGLVQSVAVGVGHWRTASVRLVPLCAFELWSDRDPLAEASPTVGVGQLLTYSVTFGVLLAKRVDLTAMTQVGVPIHTPCDDEAPPASVRGSHVTRSDARPLRIVPERGQVPEYDVEPPKREGCGVLHDNESWS
jgi:hypothetical protein